MKGQKLLPILQIISVCCAVSCTIILEEDPKNDLDSGYFQEQGGLLIDVNPPEQDLSIDSYLLADIYQGLDSYYESYVFPDGTKVDFYSASD